ncbi:MAG: hypothetical protein LQ350_004247 [Teloschistes chrysophthalmus]|nr:MAG: hypothetical protein LQ350_004247 [Niorma chrysophthalma]
MAPTTLLTLPAEIRIRVYREVLVYDVMFMIYGRDCLLGNPCHLCLAPCPQPSEKDAFRNTQFAKDFLTLFLVNRQIFNEALPIFFRENKFLADFHDFYRYFVNGIGARRMALLRDVTLFIEEDIDEAFDHNDKRKHIKAPSRPEAVFQDWPSLKVFLGGGHRLKLRLWYWGGMEGDADYFWEELVRMGILDLEGQVEFLAVHTWGVDEDKDTDCATIWKCEKGSKIQVVARDQVLPARDIRSYFPGFDTLHRNIEV